MGEQVDRPGGVRPREFDVHGLKIKPTREGWRLVKTGRTYRFKREAIAVALDIRFPYRFTGIPVGRAA